MRSSHQPRTKHQYILATVILALLCHSTCFAQPADPQNTADRWSRLFDRDKYGFTNFPLAENSRIILVSSSEGSDFNDGRFLPVRSLRKAMTLTRPGHGDRILFKRGDVFLAANLNGDIRLRGAGFDEPAIIGAYGDIRLPRPVLQGRLALGGRVTPRFIVLQSLDLYANTRDPTQPYFHAKNTNPQQNIGITMVSPGGYLWIEDCRCRDFGMGIVLQSAERDMFDTLVIRKCQVLDSWNFGMSSGIYIENLTNVLIEDNLFDHNGWVAGIPGAGKSIFNHDMYLQFGEVAENRHFIVRNNIIARAASHGCQLRPGGVLENNLFLKNPLAAYVAYSNSIVRNNVVLDADGIGPATPRGLGLEIDNCPSALVEGNIIAHKTDKTNDLEALSYNPKEHQVRGGMTYTAEFRNNIVYDWNGVAFKMVTRPNSLSVHDNIFQQTNAWLTDLKDWETGYSFSGNHYFSGKDDPFRIAKQDMDFKHWQAQTGDHSAWGQVKFADPSRDIVSYCKSIGLKNASLEGFLAAAREQRRGHWDTRLTAEPVNDYIRAGFAHP